jgi:tetratricopeptide (TPR) repeat protein
MHDDAIWDDDEFDGYEVCWDERVLARAEVAYQNLKQSLQWAEGFSVFFVRCAASKQNGIAQRIQTDLPTLQLGRMCIDADTDDEGFCQSNEAIPDYASLDVLLISGLESRLSHRLGGLYQPKTGDYKITAIPYTFGDLHLRREQLFQRLPFCLVFFVEAWDAVTIEFMSPDWSIGTGVSLELSGSYCDYCDWSDEQHHDRIAEIQAFLDGASPDDSLKISLLWEQGKIYYASQQYESAIAVYAQILNYQSNYAEVWKHRGYALIKLGECQEAIAAFDRSLHYRPDDAVTWYNRGIALSKLGQEELAIAAFDQAVKYDPELHSAWINRGCSLHQLGQYKAAIDSYDQALQYRSRHYLALNNRGCSLHQMGKYEAAIDSYDQALEADPDYHEVWKNRALALGKLSRYDGVVLSLDRYLKHHADDYDAWISRGYAMGQLGRYEDLIFSYTKAVRCKTDQRAIWSIQARIIYLCNDAIQTNPENAWVIYCRACAYVFIGDTDRAINDLTQAIQLEPENYQRQAAADPSLDRIGDEARFQALIALES